MSTNLAKPAKCPAPQIGRTFAKRHISSGTSDISVITATTADGDDVDDDEQGSAWLFDPDADADDCSCVSNRIHASLISKSCPPAKNFHCKSEQPDGRVTDLDKCRVPGPSSEEEEEPPCEEECPASEKEPVEPPPPCTPRSATEECFAKLPCDEEIDDFLEMLVHQYLSLYTFSMKATRAAWETCLEPEPIAETISPSGKVCTVKHEEAVTVELLREDLSPDGPKALSPWSPAYDICDIPPRPDYRGWVREILGWLLEGSARYRDQSRRFVRLPWVAPPAQASPSLGKASDPCREPSVEPEKPASCDTRPNLPCSPKRKTGRIHLPGTDPDGGESDDGEPGFPFATISSGALHRRGMDRFKAEPSYAENYPRFHSVPSLIMEDLCSEKHKLGLVAAERARVLAEDVASVGDAATSVIKSQGGHRPRKWRPCDPLCDAATLYDHYKHSPAAKEALAKGKPLKSKKTWMEWFEDLIFGEEDDESCTSIEEECCYPVGDEEHEDCSELDAILRARRCKKDDEPQPLKCEEPTPEDEAQIEDTCATEKRKKPCENPEKSESEHQDDLCLPVSSCTEVFPYSQVCGTASGHKLIYKYSRTIVQEKPGETETGIREKNQMSIDAIPIKKKKILKPVRSERKKIT